MAEAGPGGFCHCRAVIGSWRALSGDSAGITLHRGLTVILCSLKLQYLPWHVGGGSRALVLSYFHIKSFCGEALRLHTRCVCSVCAVTGCPGMISAEPCVSVEGGSVGLGQWMSLCPQAGVMVLGVNEQWIFFCQHLPDFHPVQIRAACLIP